MIPKINGRGHSFKGVTQYLMHDKGAESAARVAWSETGNIYTNDIERAAKIMAFTDQHGDDLKANFGGAATGAKSKAGNVYHYSLAWEIGANPTPEEQRAEALTTLKCLGLETHQYYMVAHDDTQHKHVHIVANLRNQNTGIINMPSFDKRELQTYALNYEKEHGMQCPKRAENAAKRGAGHTIKHQDTKQDYAADKVTRAYYAADSGKAFIAALNAEGLELGKARRGNSFVIVDDQGDIQKLSRQLQIEEKGKGKTQAIAAKLADIDTSSLKDGDALAKEIITNNKIRAAEKLAETQAREQEKINQENAAQELKAQAAQAAAEKAAQAKSQKARYKAYDKSLERRVAERKSRHNIEGYETQADAAQVHLQAHNGWWERHIFTKAHKQAQTDLDAASQTLDNARQRWRTDIEDFYKNRPQWVIDKVLKKEGFDIEGEKRAAQQLAQEQKAAQEKQAQAKAAEIENQKKASQEKAKALKIEQDFKAVAQDRADKQAALLQARLAENEQKYGADYDQLSPVEKLERTQEIDAQDNSHDHDNGLER